MRNSLSLLGWLFGAKLEPLLPNLMLFQRPLDSSCNYIFFKSLFIILTTSGNFGGGTLQPAAGTDEPEYGEGEEVLGDLDSNQDIILQRDESYH